MFVPDGLDDAQQQECVQKLEDAMAAARPDFEPIELQEKSI
jgi:hypothetical protein